MSTFKLAVNDVKIKANLFVSGVWLTIAETAVLASRKAQEKAQERTVKAEVLIAESIGSYTFI